ncbi:uncharacterized protein LOC131689825 [Topomyia yanbarensis]|uniref:uncharacterized protein LOC131689825 n=1 Tax=Topomyia yanbarensis TaxID=2498891 RepID=UPI00273AE940|nr:uncharacterized protein LOC131689825 [Topomyia yanbarensis]XP_058831129.1 uncharacterized protein LOC131689825 [Topomyia yanbarensis]
MAAACIICNNSPDRRPDCTLFSLPDKDEQPVEYQKYLTACDLDESCLPGDGNLLYICSTHFEPHCFEESSAEEIVLKEGAMPSLNMERIEIEAYVDEDFQILDEYMPLFNIKQTKMETEISVDLTLDDDDADDRPSVETFLVPKPEPIEEIIEEGIICDENEVKTEAPDADEGIPDPFDDLSPPADGKYCILCDDNESKNPSCKLYIFPRKIPKIYRKWMSAAGLDIEQYKNTDIYSCSRHFPKNGFFAGGKFIQSWATPNLNIPARKRPVEVPVPSTISKPQATVIDSTPETSTKEKPVGAKIIIKSNPENRKNAEALNIDPDSYAQTFAKVVMELMPKKINYNGVDRPVTGTIVFHSNLF